MEKKKCDVAAYVWPAYTGDEPRTLIFWPAGEGEWESIRTAVPQFPGHLWPRKPMWGYVNEANPAVMENQIDAAADHGISTFIYDWYWFDGRSFLSQCLENGFLKAKNRSKMKFFIMWANHDVRYTWDRRLAPRGIPVHIWQGRVPVEEFHEIGKYWIEHYFSQPEYYRIDGKPVVSYYDIFNLIYSFRSVDGVNEQFRWLEEEAKKAGFPGIHAQAVLCDSTHSGESMTDGTTPITYADRDDLVNRIAFDSVTHYQFAAMTRVNRDYAEVLTDVEQVWEETSRKMKMPYYPQVSLGWDNTPRYGSITADNVMIGNTPKAIAKGFAAAKAFAEKNGCPLITLNSWNEWTEGSYLEPDDLYGDAYLQQAKEIFGK